MVVWVRERNTRRSLIESTESAYYKLIESDHAQINLGLVLHKPHLTNGSDSIL